LKLNAKLILSLVVVLIVTVAGVQAVQYFWTMSLVSKINHHNVELIRGSQEQQAANLSVSVMRAIEGSLVRGEMEKFTGLLQSLNSVEGLQEVSLFDAEGKVTHSSKPEFIGRTLAEGVRSIILAEPRTYEHETAESLEIYQPHLVIPDCIRCHTSWRNDEIRGATMLRFSKDALVKAQGEAEHALAAARSNSLWSA
jgi:methyl-accepting chemotaxis protein